MRNFVENIPCRDQSLLLSFVWFYDGPNWSLKLCTIFEVDTFSHCVNIKEKTSNCWELPSTGPLFLLGGILWRALKNPTSLPILKSLRSVDAKILKGNPQFWGAPLAHSHVHFSSGYNFMMGLGKPKLHTKFEVASFSRCKNIKREPSNFKQLP